MKMILNKKQQQKAEILAGIGLSWLCVTKKNRIWRSDLMEVMGFFNSQENIGYKELWFFPLRILEICLETNNGVDGRW